MLNKLALALAVLIVVLLAAVAALTISASQDEQAEDDDSGLTSSEEVVEARTSVVVGSVGQPLDVECQVPVDASTPLLVAFHNASETVDDYVAKITVVYRDGSTTTALAEAAALRPGEQRAVVPEPWPDDGLVDDCRIDAIQRGEHVILLDSSP